MNLEDLKISFTKNFDSDEIVINMYSPREFSMSLNYSELDALINKLCEIQEIVNINQPAYR